MSGDVVKFTGKYEFLSNFSGSPVLALYRGSGEEMTGPVTPPEHALRVPSVEHAFQAMKCKLVEEFWWVATAARPADAKERGRRTTLRTDWVDVRLQVMLWLLRQKFQDAELARKLLATGDVQLIEGNWWGDRFWGVSQGAGKNHLGRLLMQVREELRGAEGGVRDGAL